MTIIEVLTWLGGAGVSAVSAFVLSRIASFEALPSGGKQLVAMSIAVIIGALSIALRDYFVATPDVAAKIEPYAQLLIAAASIMIQQIAHGVDRAKEYSNG